MMLRYSLGAPEAADRVEAAVARVLEQGDRTRDLGGDLGTRAIGDRLLDALG
jgi:3-isopropylmalate dehydrogenase